MSYQGIILHSITFTGATRPSATVSFKGPIDLIFGASNTGKSYIIKTIDYMLGGKKLKYNEKSVGYDICWLSFELKGVGTFTLSRALKGGDFKLYKGITTEHVQDEFMEELNSQHQSGANVSSFIMNYLGIKDKVIVSKKGNLKKNSLTFRNVIKVALALEKSIYDEDHAPIHTGDSATKTSEEATFRFLMTGMDDSSVISVQSAKDFKTTKESVIQVLEGFEKDTEKRLEMLFDDPRDLSGQFERINAALTSRQQAFNLINHSVRQELQRKNLLIRHIPVLGQRVDEIHLHQKRFNILLEAYDSDIARLRSLEEISFLVGVEQMNCDVCGAAPEHQRIAPIDVGLVGQAALKEIQHIEIKKQDLLLVINELNGELSRVSSELEQANKELKAVEEKINGYSPDIIANQTSLNTLVAARDKINEGLMLIKQKVEIQRKLANIRKERKPQPAKIIFELPDKVAFDFAAIIKEILLEWHFPGKCEVTFDPKTWDIIIDGNPRTSNGKGVRAITHAAYKLAIMLYCRRNNLPHPGFLILDTPLLAYRDPIKTKEPLTLDERELVEVGVAHYFFEHLSSICQIGQFIIMENVELPSGIDKKVNLQIFTGEPDQGRYGLFP